MVLGAGVCSTGPIRAASASLAAPATLSKGSYAWAVATARAQNAASPELLAEALKITRLDARKLYARLLERGVITAPDAFGISRATQPLFHASRSVATLGAGVAERGIKHPPASATPSADPARVLRLENLTDTKGSAREAQDPLKDAEQPEDTSDTAPPCESRM